MNISVFFEDLPTATVTDATYVVKNLPNGMTYYFTVKAGNLVGLSAASNQASAVPNAADASPSEPEVPAVPAPTGSPSPAPTGSQSGTPADDGVTVTIITKDGRTIAIAVIDEKHLQEKLAAQGQNAQISIPVNAKADVAAGELNGQMIKMMEDKQAVLEMKTETAVYTLPAQQINIGAISNQFGQSVALQDIKIRIEIAAPKGDTGKIVENAAKAGTFSIVAPPVEFTVKASNGDKTIELSKFNAYVERTIAIPDGVDPSKITTGVVFDPDGTVRHVPTKIVVIAGKYYAKINSLTNSVYSVIWHSVTFSDVNNHWSKDAVNDMGSRFVVNGTSEGRFSPDQDITRAEFAAILARGLGLKLEAGTGGFKDVKGSEWYSSAIQTAQSYGLIQGFEDGTFRPNDKITREQAMVIIAKAMKIAGLPTNGATDGLVSFKDAADASEWAIQGIADTVQASIVSGRNGTELAPKSFITRAEVAAIVQRLLKKSDLI